MKYDKTIMITGGAGFIGSHVVRLFVTKYPNYRIINFDALTYAGNLENLEDICNNPNYVFAKGNISDKRDILDIFTTFEVTDVIHLAAESHVDRSVLDPDIFTVTNVLGTINLLNVAKNFWKDDYTNHRFINMGTDEIYGELKTIDEPAFNENSPMKPRSPYSTSKTAQVMYGYTYYNTYGVPVINTSCGNAIGPNQFPEKLVPLVIDRLVNKQHIPVYGKGLQIRDWTSVFDIADAIDVIFRSGHIGEMYCIGGDGCCSNIEMIQMIIKEYAKHILHLGRKLRSYEPLTEDNVDAYVKVYSHFIDYIPDPRGNAHDFRYDIDHTKLTNELGWTPKYNLEQCVHDTVDWYINNTTWVNHCKTDEYKTWLDKNYKQTK